jgi:hypothetical protein
MRAYIEIDSIDCSATIYISVGEHQHNSLITSRGLDQAVTEEIERLFDSGVTKPKSILINLLQSNMDIEKTKLNTFLNRLNKKNFGD